MTEIYKKEYINLLRLFAKSEIPIKGMLKMMDDARNNWLNEKNNINK